ncbi:hypothetical protein HDV00_004950 [Rhizophlyctis rosea]|nr:hypothetical protein HDV00_004950 [Rhizophlyctis rosea]
MDANEVFKTTRASRIANMAHKFVSGGLILGTVVCGVWFAGITGNIVMKAYRFKKVQREEKALTAAAQEGAGASMVAEGEKSA